MAKIVLNPVTNGNTLSVINANFDKIEAEFQDKVVYRDNPIGETNTVRNDLDLDNNNLFNANEVRVQELYVKDVLVEDILKGDVAAAEAAKDQALAAAEAAGGSANSAAANADRAEAAADEAVTIIPPIQVTSYTTLRSYAGVGPSVYVLQKGTAGTFVVDLSDVTTVDNSGTVIVDTSGRRWKRRFSGPVAVEWFGAQADGVYNDSLAFNLAIASGAKEIQLNDTTYTLATTVSIPDGIALTGKGKKATILNYVGAGTAINLVSSLGTGNRIFSNSIRNILVQTSTGVTGIDMDSVSEGLFNDITIAGFSGSGLKIHSSVSGGAVYNRFYAVKSQSCGVGFELVRDGAGISSYTNDNTFSACRANVCGKGIAISGGNHNVFSECQIEVCTTALEIVEPVTASTNENVFAFCRFENNTNNGSIGVGVVSTVLCENMFVDGPAIVNSGTRTQIIGNYGTQHSRVSQLQIPTGSFRYERTANGGTEIPALVVHDASSVNSPVTLEVHNPATGAGASFFRTRFGGDAGTIKFDIACPSGKIQGLGTTNGPTGSFTCAAAAATVINNTCVSASSRIFLQPANVSAATLTGSSACLYISTRIANTSFQVNTASGAAATGVEVFNYWIVN